LGYFRPVFAWFGLQTGAESAPRIGLDKFVKLGPIAIPPPQGENSMSKKTTGGQAQAARKH